MAAAIGSHYAYLNSSLEPSSSDCSSLNIMMDATQMYPNGFHPLNIEKNRNYRGKARYTTRTACNPKYYLIDFGISGMYNPTDGPPLDYGIHGADRTLPEFQGVDCHNEMHNPFPTDVYYLGNMIKREFIEGWDGHPEGYRGFEFMQPLVQDMVADDPTKRPTIDEVVVRFDRIRRSLSTRKLRSRPIPRKEIHLATLFQAIPHWFRRIGKVSIAWRKGISRGRWTAEKRLDSPSMCQMKANQSQSPTFRERSRCGRKS
ncbi:hypothetical protein C8R43DRAFT_952958 [Mycena crocata]|nr:hypothetical protein C8R43DRAFT_952958 [Mycena crocata]